MASFTDRLQTVLPWRPGAPTGSCMTTFPEALRAAATARYAAQIVLLRAMDDHEFASVQIERLEPIVVTALARVDWS